nr:DNA translocase FtsK [Aminobacter sp. HY435]
MRFPRTNHSNTTSQGDAKSGVFDDRANKSGGQPLSAADGPGWQDYFFLAPNVRFTRTPDYDAAKRGLREEHDAECPEAQAPEPTVAQAPVVPAAPIVAAVPQNPVTAAPAPAVRQPFSPARPQVQHRETAAPVGLPYQAPTVRPSVATPVMPAARHPSPAVDGQTQPETPSHWAYLSDHAFFEFGAPCGAEAAAPPSAAPVAPAPRVAPVLQPTRSAAAMPAAAGQVPAVPAVIHPAEITAMFRVIECTPGAQPAPAAEPIAKAEAEPAAPAETVIEQPVAALATPRVVSRVAANDAAPVAPAAKSVEITMPAPRAPSLPVAGRVVQAGYGDDYTLPPEELLQLPPEGQGFYMSQERLEQNADLLESVLEDFGVRGEIIHVRPGPVVTLYEFEPAPGVKSSRVIGLADDIARSMSAVSARVAVIPGRNVIGIELPNETRETVYFRELIESANFRESSCKLALCLGKTIGGEPVIAELAKMPHLLVAGTTGSGKSVAINTMILSLLYRLKPEECRLIMVDPKMLELSIYDGIPHLLTPVVTDPKKAVTALKWAVREMEDRYRKMARLGVRNIDGYNERAAVARDKGETVVMQVQTGFEKGTGEPLFEEQEIDLAPMPYIVVIVDEMADLMMVAGKEIEGAIQRLAQMARAAGIHLIMATQRPSVDVITGTIKANFPTRISFQVTSKIDSRTILGEQGAEQLLGQGDMLHMAGGGRIARVHGPFVSDAEVEHVVAHLKAQGRPEYLETVTADEEEEEADQGPVFDKGAVASEDGDTTYEEAVKVVQRDKKCSTSYIQRRLGIGYNRAASLVERMEKEGLVGAPNHVGKREIMTGRRDVGNPTDRED